MLVTDETGELSRQINAQINLLSPKLAWEVGPGQVARFMLAFPSEGDSERKAVIDRIMLSAPRIDGWEFHTSRPPRAFQQEVRLPELGLRFETSGWRFTLDPSSTSDKFDLKIFDKRLATFDDKTSLTAVFILLDAVLGEDVVERWIGGIQVLPGRGERIDALPMSAISERIGELVPR